MPHMANTQTNDFSKGSVAGNILRLALPMTVAQLINVLYSVVDRMYIGRLPDAAGNALTGLGLTFPILSIVTAFANLFGMGGSPLFSIQRGKDDRDRAQVILGNTFALLVGTGVALTVVLLVLKRPLLYAFGASDATYPYADGYLTIYLLGSVFVMISLGMNQFINAQGFGRTGMLTVLIGAVTNILLDPVFIFVLGMGVQGAALATILSQFLSAVWAVSFLRGKKALIRLEWGSMRLQPKLVWQIVSLGFSSFVMAITNSIVQVACNSTLQTFGGDLYVGVMTIINSVREVVSTPINGVTSAAQPVMGFNYGARRPDRVLEAQRYIALLCIAFTAVFFLVAQLIPQAFVLIFTRDPAYVSMASRAIRIFTLGIIPMGLQYTIVDGCTGMGVVRASLPLSFWRKGLYFVSLFVLPALFGAQAVFFVIFFTLSAINRFLAVINSFLSLYAAVLSSTALSHIS